MVTEARAQIDVKRGERGEITYRGKEREEREEREERGRKLDYWNT
jgi:hypothetical protein